MKEYTKEEFNRIIAQAKKTKTKEEYEQFRQKMSQGAKEGKFKVVDRAPGFTERINTSQTSKGKGYTEKISDKKVTKGNFSAPVIDKKAETKKISKIGAWENKIAKAKKASKLKRLAKIGRSLKGLPVVGAIAALATGEDATAAMPILGSVESLGRGSDLTKKQRSMSKAQQKAAFDKAVAEAKERNKGKNLRPVSIVEDIRNHFKKKKNKVEEEKRKKLQDNTKA
jgi:hypothetical protein